MFWPNPVESVTKSFASVSRDPGERKQGTRNTGPMLFGFHLVDNSSAEGNMLVDTVSVRVKDSCPVLCLYTESEQHSEPSHVNQSEIPSVHMQGIAVGGAVDLTRFDGYEDVLKKLEEIFDIDGELCGSTTKWQVVYTDDEDDMMMVGDNPWHEFCRMEKKIFIYTSEVKRLSPKTELASNENAKTSKLAVGSFQHQHGGLFFGGRPWMLFTLNGRGRLTNASDGGRTTSFAYMQWRVQRKSTGIGC